MSYPSISVVMAVEGAWVHTLTFTLYSIARQWYPLDFIEVIIVTIPEHVAAVTAITQRFTSFAIKILVDEISGVHAPSYRKRLTWQHATGEICIGLDADVILPAFSFSHLTTIIAAYPSFVVYGSDRENVALTDLKPDLGQLFRAHGIDEYDIGGRSGEPVLESIYAKHPWSGASFLFAVRRELVTAEDFVTDYDGIWGVEDNDFSVSLYERGIHPISQPDLLVLHWTHPTQSDDLYDAQTALFFARHPRLCIVQPELVFMYSRRRLVNWQKLVQQPFTYKVAFEIRPYTYINSSAMVMHSLSLGMRTQANLDGRPLPTISPLTDIKYSLPFPELEIAADRRAVYSSETQLINIRELTYGTVINYSFQKGYNIGCLALEGTVLDPSYLSYLQPFDALWVPSERNANTLRQSGWNKPIGVIPHGVYSSYFFPHAYRPKSADTFRFLSVGTGARKQVFELIDLFAQTFSPSEQVSLTLGDTYQAPHIAQYIKQRWPQWESLITVINEELNYYQVGQLFLSSDAFISASRGEAWQLPVLDAMACGIPVIVPRNSGIPYVNETNAVLYASTLVRANAPYGYIEPDLADLGQKLRQIVENPQPYRQRAAALLPVIHTKYTWFEAARIAWKWLDDNVISGEVS